MLKVMISKDTKHMAPKLHNFSIYSTVFLYIIEGYVFETLEIQKILPNAMLESCWQPCSGCYTRYFWILLVNVQVSKVSKGFQKDFKRTNDKSCSSGKSLKPRFTRYHALCDTMDAIKFAITTVVEKALPAKSLASCSSMLLIASGTLKSFMNTPCMRRSSCPVKVLFSFA